MRFSLFAILVITWLVGLASGYNDPTADSCAAGAVGLG